MLERIKFIGDTLSTIYDVTISYVTSEIKRITFEENRPDVGVMTSGFQVLDDKDRVMGDFPSFCNIYQDNTINPDFDENAVDLTCVAGKRWSGDVYTPADEVVQIETIEIAKAKKINELSACCKNAIESGVTINGETFSYSENEDQLNIKKLFDLARSTKESVPHHPNDKSCRLFSLSEITEIYVAEEKNLLINQTYFNQAKMMIRSLVSDDDIEFVNNFTYGDELIGEYLETFNNIIAHSDVLVNAEIGIDVETE